MTSYQSVFRFRPSILMSLFSTTLMMAGCGETPSFTEAGAQQASLPSSDDVSEAACAGTNLDCKDPSDVDTADGGDTGNTTGGDGLNGTTSGSTAGGSTAGGSTAGGSTAGGSGNETLPTLALADESTTIKSQSKVDILWVVDVSGSMQEEQQYLGQNFSSFMNQLVASGTNFQTGITTTDVCTGGNPAQISMNARWCPVQENTAAIHYQGSLVGDTGFRVLTPAYSDLTKRFQRYALQGINGSGFEHGLKAAEMAVAKSLNNQNENLVRSDAFLAVIVVSDEEDDGIGLGKKDYYSGRNFVEEGLTSARYTDDNLISYLSTVKGAGKFSVSAITGTRLANGKMCSASHSQPMEEGTQYISAARKTGGIIQSICDTNWSNSLTSLGKDIAGQSAQVVLKHIAYPETIKVYVQGVLTTQWTYNSGNNAVKFNSGYVPASGSTVRITYKYAQ